MNYQALQEAIATAIKTNGEGEITGAVLQSVLQSMVSIVGANYQYMGVATTSTNPGTPAGSVFYLTSTAGTYTNFSGIVVEDGKLTALMWNSTAWSKSEIADLSSSASDVSYDNTTSGLTASNVQEAIDELSEGGGNVDYDVISGSNVQLKNEEATPIYPKTNVEMVEGLALIENNSGKLSIADPDGNVIAEISQTGLTIANINEGKPAKYVSIGDSITAGSQVTEAQQYQTLLSKKKNLAWSKTETSGGTTLGYILIKNGKEDEYVALDDMPSGYTEVFGKTYSQNNINVYAYDGTNYYRRFYQMACGGKALYGELSISCGDARYLNADMISLLIGLNDVSSIDSAGNTYSLGTIDDIPIGLTNYYLLSTTYADLLSAITAIPTADRKLGMRLEYRNSATTVADKMYYIGTDTNDANWLDTSNWKVWYQCTFYMFLKGAVQRVMSENPTSNVMLMSYLQFDTTEFYATSVGAIGNVGTYGKVMEALRNVATKYNVPYVDIFEQSGVNGYNYTSYFNNSPNVHPNANGHRMMAKRIAKVMNDNFLIL